MHKRGLDVALMNGLTLQDSKIFAFVLERGGDSGSVQTRLPTFSHDVNGILESDAPEVRTNSMSLDETLRRATTILAAADLSASQRMLTTIAALQLLPKECQGLVIPTLQHCVILGSTSLSNRRLPQVSFEYGFENVYEDFIGCFCQEARRAIPSIKSTYKEDHTLVDLIDGRLLRFILANQKLYHPILKREHLDAIVEVATLLICSVPHRQALPGVPMGSPTQDQRQATGAVLPFSHPAFDKHLECIKVHVDGEAESHAGRLSLELTHWHNTKKLSYNRSKAAGPLGGPQSDAVKAKARELRSYQRFIARQTAYAISLSGTLTLSPDLVFVKEPEKGGKKQKMALKSTKKHVIAPTKNGKKKTLETVEPKEARAPSIEEQLRTRGPYFDRSMDASDDPRVPFRPDAWQKDVLDELDQGNSLLVVAPTSAGKTFESFYAMRKVLEAADDDVLVYVAPTKALVNQIAAEVQAKFRKPKLAPGRTLWSIFTRDYRVHEPMNAQILVTVPHMLQIMLMSSSNKNWVPRIKTIIFDEVHSVANADDGLVWEQLLMSAPCQIVALSATIGNTLEFAKWLSASQARVGRTCTLIKHDHRYSDLRKYLFSSPKLQIDGGLPADTKEANHVLGLEHLVSVKTIHPAACTSHGIPDDLSLEAADCLILYETMVKHQSPSYLVPDALHPTAFSSNAIVKADVIRWATALKVVLTKWQSSSDSPFDLVVRDLNQNLNGLENAQGATVQEARNQVLDSTMPLLCELKANHALPAILFNFNRGACEDIAQHVLGLLVDAEQSYKEHSPAFQKKLEQYEDWQKGAKIREKKQKSGGKSKKKNAADSEDSHTDSKAKMAMEGDESDWNSFRPEATLDRFSFANIKKGDIGMFDDLFRQLRRAHVLEYLIECFQRGIGVHHSGLNKWYRQAVEMFFRKGYLTIVVATGTLSLGINMPCKTVVFSGDSVFLTALNYRQSSGRAGRRGFDLLGNVIFQSIPTNKVLRLISSKLPDINGHFPMTTVFLLRILALLQGTENAKYAMTMTDSLLSQPRLFLGGDEYKQQVLHHIRFSIEYFRSQGIINGAGLPIGFANCVSHLYYVENNALAFHALLKEGYFHWLALTYSSKRESTLRNLMVVLAHLFGRRFMRPSDDDIPKNTISRVFLPALPEEAAKILKEHNEQILATYRTYVSTFVDQHCKDDDVTLPFTGTSMSNTANVPLAGRLTTTKMRLAFVALSGHGDNFTSVSELCDSV